MSIDDAAIWGTGSRKPETPEEKIARLEAENANLRKRLGWYEQRDKERRDAEEHAAQLGGRVGPWGPW